MAWGGTILSMNFGFDDFDNSDGGEMMDKNPLGVTVVPRNLYQFFCAVRNWDIYIFFLRRELKGFRTSPRMIGRDDTSVRKQIGRPKALKINGWMGQFCRNV